MSLFQTLYTGDITKVNLTPIIKAIWVKSTGALYTGSMPMFRELGFGVYDIEYSELTVSVTILIDFGATVSEADRYVPVDLYPATDDKIVITDEAAGQFEVVFEVLDGDLNTISNVDVRVYLGSEVNAKYTRQTNTAGITKLCNLDEVEYRVVCSKVGYEFDVETITPTASGTITITGTGIIVAPVSVDEQYIYTELKNIGLIDDGTTTIYMRPKSRNVGTGGTVFNYDPVAFDKVGNLHSITTARGIEVEVYATSTKGELIRKTFTVSEAATATLKSYF
jgi:hypothetical protein